MALHNCPQTAASFERPAGARFAGFTWEESMKRFRWIVRLLAAASLASAGGIALAAPAPPVVPSPAPSSVLSAPSISLAEARAIIDAAIAYARERNVLMAVTVVDAAGNPVASERMDGVSPNNVLYAEGKAFAAALQRQTTET